MKKRILVADNDGPVRKMVGRVLESENYDVQLVQVDGGEFASAIAKTPDLVLLDVDLSCTQGRNALETIDAMTSSVPVIVIAASPKVASAVAHARVSALLEKPLDVVQLLGMISNLLKDSDPACDHPDKNGRAITA